MRIHIKPRYQPQQELALEEVNAMLRNGVLDGDEPAWTAGLDNWTLLRGINGVQIPSPPAFATQLPNASPPPFRPETLPQVRRCDPPILVNSRLPYSYKDSSSLTKFVVALLGLGIALSLVSLVSSFMQAELLSRASFTTAEANANDEREQVIGLLTIVLYLLTVVFFGWWIVRSNKNVRALGAVGLRITPGWALGYFFVPVINLWRPYQAMKDLWRASYDPASWELIFAGPLVLAWWTLWLISNFLGQLTFRLSMSAQKIEELQVATFASIVTEALSMVVALLAIMLVNQITRTQRTAANKLLCHTPAFS